MLVGAQVCTFVVCLILPARLIVLYPARGEDSKFKLTLFRNHILISPFVVNLIIYSSCGLFFDYILPVLLR